MLGNQSVSKDVDLYSVYVTTRHTEKAMTYPVHTVAEK